jgi:hypothetical protein
MQFINRPNTIEHLIADCDCVPCVSLLKPDAASDNHHNNVILFVAASKPVQRIEAINFKYPMLECS